jgi:hypothetical protein
MLSPNLRTPGTPEKFGLVLFQVTCVNPLACAHISGRINSESLRVPHTPPPHLLYKWTRSWSGSEFGSGSRLRIRPEMWAMEEQPTRFWYTVSQSSDFLKS